MRLQLAGRRLYYDLAGPEGAPVVCIAPAAENRRLAGLVPGGRYDEIVGMRHFPNVEAPDAFNHIPLDWLGSRSTDNERLR